MKMFGKKAPQETDEDRAAAARLRALEARLKPQESLDLTEVSPDPLGEPEAGDEPAAVEELDAQAEPQAPGGDE
jgi:hypothetical protein